MTDVPRIAVDVPTAVGMTGMSRAYIYNAMKAGELPHLKVGRSRRILVADLARWLESHRVAA